MPRGGISVALDLLLRLAVRMAATDILFSAGLTLTVEGAAGIRCGRYGTAPRTRFMHWLLSRPLPGMAEDSNG